MTTSRLEGETFTQRNTFFYQGQLNKIIHSIIPQFEMNMRSYAIFNMIFLVLGLIEILILLFFFTFLAKSSLLSIALASLFLTSFSYFILRVYYKTKKPEQLRVLKNKFFHSVQKELDYQEGDRESHISMGNAFYKLSEEIKGKEHDFYKPIHWLSFLSSSMEKFSFWWHWQDVHQFRELALETYVEEHIKLVKFEATSQEAHTLLANAYVQLSDLYASNDNTEESLWNPSEMHSKAMEQKFRIAAERAIEEFKILSAYSPNDPWVHQQLAYSYHDLNMPLEEIKEYEIVLKLTPGDPETLYKLGTLYFQLGRNALGLQVYEQLKNSHYKKAEALIKQYGALS